MLATSSAPKPVASCGYPVMEGMVVKTDTPQVHEARKAMLEFLLASVRDFAGSQPQSDDITALVVRCPVD